MQTNLCRVPTLHIYIYIANQRCWLTDNGYRYSEEATEWRSSEYSNIPLPFRSSLSPPVQLNGSNSLLSSPPSMFDEKFNSHDPQNRLTRTDVNRCLSQSFPYRDTYTWREIITAYNMYIDNICVHTVFIKLNSLSIRLAVLELNINFDRAQGLLRIIWGGEGRGGYIR